MKLLIAILFILMASALPTLSQTVECPQGYVCITQEAAKKARDNALEVQKIPVLEDALKSKDESIAELKATNDRNVADLKEALKKTEIELARITGQLTARESEVVRQTAIIEALVKMVRPKKFGVIVF